MTKNEEDEALEFLKDPELFSQILVDFETVGITGEDANKLMGYLSATSRKLDEPLSIMVQSRSAAGKSTLQDAVLSLIPEEDYIKYTRINRPGPFLQRRRQPGPQAPCHRGRARRAGRLVLYQEHPIIKVSLHRGHGQRPRDRASSGQKSTR